MKKQYSEKEIAAIFENWLWRKCKGDTKKGAELLGVSRDMINKMLSGDRIPNNKALDLMKFKKVKKTHFERV